MNTDAGGGDEDDAAGEEQSMSHRRKAAFSVLQGIRRHYASIVDLISYVGLGLVFYAGAPGQLAEPLCEQSPSD